MKHPSPADIEEMRARGYDTSTIKEAEEQLPLWHAAQEVARKINEAFRDVRLGGGVGLGEGQVMDGYGTPEERAAALARDESEDWRRIPTQALNSCSSSLSFFDAEGMRFHLPAFILAEIEGKGKRDLAFHLGRAEAEQFGLLDGVQREAVRSFIDYMISYEVGYMTEEIGNARRNFWGERGDV